MKVPKYRKHSSRNFGFVEWNRGRHRLPGEYNSRESRQAYNEFLAKFVYGAERATTKNEGPSVWLNDVIVRYLEFARKRHPGTNGEYDVIRASVAELDNLFPGLLAKEFGPRRLKEYQKHLDSPKISRGYINARISRVRRMFKWAVSEELVPASVYAALRTVEALKPGECEAVERARRKPVPWESVEPVLEFLSPTLQAMVMLQWHTGVRSQNIVDLAPGQIDFTVRPAEWRPPRHKTLYRGKQLLVFVGANALNAIKPFLDRPDDKPCFSPRESLQWYYDQAEAKRQCARYPSEPKRVKTMNRRARDHYDSRTYQKAISTGIDNCNADRKKRKMDPVPYWTPHQIRHAKATEVRAVYGLEAAQAALGHSSIDATQIYAEQNLELARRVALDLG